MNKLLNIMAATLVVTSVVGQTEVKINANDDIIQAPSDGGVNFLEFNQIPASIKPTKANLYISFWLNEHISVLQNNGCWNIDMVSNVSVDSNVIENNWSPIGGCSNDNYVVADGVTLVVPIDPARITGTNVLQIPVSVISDTIITEGFTLNRAFANFTVENAYISFEATKVSRRKDR